MKRYGIKNVIKSFGNTGKVVGLVDSALSATTWNQWANIGLSASQTISKIAKDFKNYKKIGRAIGTKNAVSYFLKKQVGLRNVGHASTASSPMSRFYNNLHNTTSSFNLKDAFAPLTGAKGVKTTVAAWADVALTGVTNAFSNIQEQKDSNGKMSTGRVVAETISETALDTVITYGGSAVVGAAITAATGVVAADWQLLMQALKHGPESRLQNGHQILYLILLLMLEKESVTEQKPLETGLIICHLRGKGEIK